MNFTTAQALAASTLAAFKFTTNKGREQPDATTTLARTIYDGPRGRGWEVVVTLKGKVNDLRIIRHFGPEATRAKPDPTFIEAQAAAVAALAKQPFRTLTADRIRAATTLDDLLYDAAADTEEKMDALRLQCADHSQRRLDAFATGLGYDNITTLRAAALSTIPRFHAEGVSGQAAWDAEWSAAQAFIVSVQSGAVEPTFDNYKAALPATFTPPAY